jgi:hypothetical protein
MTHKIGLLRFRRASKKSLPTISFSCPFSSSCLCPYPCPCLYLLPFNPPHCVGKSEIAWINHSILKSKIQAKSLLILYASCWKTK